MRCPMVMSDPQMCLTNPAYPACYLGLAVDGASDLPFYGHGLDALIDLIC